MKFVMHFSLALVFGYVCTGFVYQDIAWPEVASIEARALFVWVYVPDAFVLALATSNFM